jgi:hypothetical protein
MKMGRLHFRPPRLRVDNWELGELKKCGHGLGGSAKEHPFLVFHPSSLNLHPFFNWVCRALPENDPDSARVRAASSRGR